jgi:GT2 family glycosyltransferase
MSPTLSVVVPTKDRPVELSQVVDDLLEQTLPPTEIVVVDQSNSTEPRCLVAAVLRRHLDGGGRNVQWVYRHDPSLSGLTAARNLGIESSRGDIILFLDDDVRLDPRFVEEIATTYGRWPELGGVAGVVTNYDPPPVGQRVFGRIFRRGPFHDPRQTLYHHADRLRTAEPIPIDRLGGGLMSFRREVFQSLRFDTTLTGYCLGEDVDFSFAVSRQYRLAINPRARLQHLRSPGTRPASSWATQEMRALRFLYRKHWATGIGNRLCYVWLQVGFFLGALAVTVARSSRTPLIAWREGLRDAPSASYPPASYTGHE